MQNQSTRKENIVLDTVNCDMVYYRTNLYINRRWDAGCVFNLTFLDFGNSKTESECVRFINKRERVYAYK